MPPWTIFKMNAIRIGVLGCANIAARSLLPAFAGHAAFVVTGIASRDPAKAAPLAAQYRCQAMGYDELVTSARIDAVYIPLPTGLHAEWAARCLENKKHVLCEKSLATTRDDVRSLVALARKNHVLLVENFQFRFHSQHAYVKDLLTSARLGDIRCFRSSFGFPLFKDPQNIRYKKALGGGALLDAGAYTLKAVAFVMGDGFRVKAATLWRPPNVEVDMGGGAYLENQEGVMAEVAFGFDHFYQCNYELWGSKGRLVVKRAFTAPPGFAPEVTLETAEGVTTLVLSPDDHFTNMLTHFAGCIEAQRYEEEYNECLTQAELVHQVLELSHG